ncbi:MAG: V-type ATP synthase subunit A [Clostridiales bacterium]|nr:V-type ATP synthase subunit A [Clostridiales bacterium]MCD7827664.1 V-type ATP synthase subunit A [Clostridiales bacterium]
MSQTNYIYGINGPVVTIKGKTELKMMEMVYVGENSLAGEVIKIDDEYTTIQVYEDTVGLHPGEKVISTGAPMSVTLGPGLLGNIYDGIQKPLTAIADEAGVFLTKGISTPSIDFEKKWRTTMLLKAGDTVQGGEILAECDETPIIKHRALVPTDCRGEVIFAADDGEYTVNDCIAKVKCTDGSVRELTLAQKWPIRTPRPAKERLPITKPLVTGQRIIDTMFPVAMGGAAAIPGGFGTGKTVTQHQLAKFSDADIIVYVGCGERGNEMTQALTEFSELTDPSTGRPLLERTILIANTSNMPVAAREASIYTGITLAEYYRDMGYNTALMADSTSRWAEALREISGRLEEMPADEGYPAYLPSRLSEFYERAGYFETFCGKKGSITLIGAVSPQGADFSEPVTQNTKRFTRCFWALDKSLAYARHYPAINWNDSYSEYISELTPWYEENVSPYFIKYRNEIASILAEESKLMEIVKLIGSEILPDDQKLTLEIARVIRIGFLQQNALHETDTYTPIIKHFRMMETILHLNEKSKEALARQIPVSAILATGLFDKVIKMKYDVPNDKPEVFDEYITEITNVMENL